MTTSGNSATKGVSFDVNRRLVYTIIELGCGFEGLAILSSIMNMPCLTKSAYYKQLESILAVLEVDIPVSFDGTWAKRGFTSLNGVVFVISVDTGEVLTIMYSQNPVKSVL